MDNAKYHAHPAISKSHLDMVAKSPLHYWARFVDPDRVIPEPTAAMAIGTAVHTRVLEPDSWDSSYCVAPEGINRRTKDGKAEWEAFTTASEGRTVLSKEDDDLVRLMSLAVRQHPAAAALLAMPGMAESTWMTHDESTGLQLKCRPDWLTNDGKYIVDLKTTADASPREFARSIAQWRYHVQAGFYMNVVDQATGVRPEQFLFICVEKKPPYVCAVYAADEQMIAMGAEVARRDLDTLAIAKAADAWPGYSDQVESISLPAWMRPKADGTMPAPSEIEMY